MMRAVNDERGNFLPRILCGEGYVVDLDAVQVVHLDIRYHREGTGCARDEGEGREIREGDLWVSDVFLCLVGGNGISLSFKDEETAVYEFGRIQDAVCKWRR